MEDGLYLIESCEFIREKGGEWESGLLLNQGRLGILDMMGEKINAPEEFKVIAAIAIDLSELASWSGFSA